MFLISLAIGCQRLKIRPDHGGDTATPSLPDNFAGRGPALAKRFLLTVNCHRQTNFVAVSETVRDGFDCAKDIDGHVPDEMSFDAVVEQTFCRFASNRGLPHFVW